MASSDLETRVGQYLELNHIEIEFANPMLGSGQDGKVWRTSRRTGVKSFERRRNYDCELGCYQRLSELEITEIDGFAVPRLVGFDDALWIVEMDIVMPPFLLDFGKAYLDSAPEHTPEVMEDWEKWHSELWGNRWPVVKLLLWELERIGIYYQDPRPANIMFADGEAGP